MTSRLRPPTGRHEGTPAVAYVSAAASALALFLLLAASPAYAQIDSVQSISPESQTVVYGNDWSVDYSVTVATSSPGDPEQRTVLFTVTSAPESITASFAPQSVATSAPHDQAQSTLYLSPSGLGPPAGEYTIEFQATDQEDGTFVVGSMTLTVDPRPISGTFTVTERAYDGTTSATVTSRALIGVLPGDVGQVALTGGTAQFPSADVTSGPTALSLTGASLTGAAAGNYTLPSDPSTTSTIVPRTLTVSGEFAAAGKEYDGTADATVTSSTLTLANVVAGDDVSYVAPQAAFPDEGAGDDRTVTLTGLTLTGEDAANYTVSFAGAPTATANVTRRQLTGTFTAESRQYDGTAEADVASTTLAGLLLGDSATLSGTATFSSPAVGNDRTVTLSNFTLSGPDAGNYTVTSVATTTANISRRTLSVSFPNVSKVYDGTTSVSLVPQLSGVITGDVVSAQLPAAAFSSATVGTGKTVSFSGVTLTGASSGNYQLDRTSGTTTGAITVRTLRLGGSFSVEDKTFDGKTDATIRTSSLTLTGVPSVSASGPISGQSLSVDDVVVRFDSSAVGPGRTVRVISAAVKGATAANYTLSLDGAPTATAEILPVEQASSGSSSTGGQTGTSTGGSTGATTSEGGDGADTTVEDAAEEGGTISGAVEGEFLPSDALTRGPGARASEGSSEGPDSDEVVASDMPAQTPDGGLPLLPIAAVVAAGGGGALLLVVRRRSAGA